jgi:hypothetical protein
MPDTKHIIRQYSLEPGALEVQYIEDYFGEFRNKKTAEEIVRRLSHREHLILLSMAPSPDEDDPDRLIPVSFKVGHELKQRESEPQLVELLAELRDCVDFQNRRIFYSWLGGTRGPWRGCGHYRALTEQQEEWAHRSGFNEIVVKTKNKFYPMRATLAQLRFNVIRFQSNPDDEAESKMYLSKKIGPDTLQQHQTQRSVVVSI